MERKFRYGIWKMPEWNGMEDFKNGMENNFPSQFHTRFRALYLQKNLYGFRVLLQKYSTSDTRIAFRKIQIICRKIQILKNFVLSNGYENM